MKHQRPRDETGNSILLYSASKESIEDYAITLRKLGVTFDTATHIPEVKKMLKSGIYDALLADVTNFESSGRRLIHWAKAHMPKPFKTHGYMRTDIPNLEKKIYCQGVDQRFYYDHADIDHLADVLFSMFISHPDLSWIRDMTAGQKKLRKQINGKPAMSCPVLLSGAKGVGKESLSLLAHCLGTRFSNKFMVLDCNPRQKFDYVHRENKDCMSNREMLRKHFECLFGEANNGTVYFRSFTHMPLMVQEVLADFFERGRCRNPQTGHMMKFDGRIIFSTNKSLPELVRKNKVSARLYSKLMEASMVINPLAKYKNDLLEMAEAIVDQHCTKVRGKSMNFSPTAKKAMLGYSWPGNIDEMSRVLSTALITARKREIRVDDLTLIVPAKTDIDYPAFPDSKDALSAAIVEHKGNISQLAKSLGCSRGFIYKKMKELGMGTGKK